MARKDILAPQLVSSNQTLAVAFNSPPTVIDFMDNCSYQINITTSNSTGTFAVQGSLDYVPQTNNGPTPVAGNWATLDLSGTPTAGAANDTILISMVALPFRAIRVSYTPTVAGTGTASIYVMNKQSGG